MTVPTIGSDFRLLAAAADYIKSEFPSTNDAWDQSPFRWILSIPSASKGKLGKRLVTQWCALKGLPVESSPDPEADMLINKHRAEVKFSTLWKVGIYKFQQFRNQNYEYAVCLGISPQEAHCWVVSKKLLIDNVIGHTGQHTGSSGKDTAWLTVKPHEPPSWMTGCGGTLDQAYQVLINLRRR
jgi:hypothetical protein